MSNKYTIRKIFWFYEVLLNGDIIGSVQRVDNGQYKGLFEAHGNDNYIYRAKTRKQAIQDMIEQNRGR